MNAIDRLTLILDSAARRGLPTKKIEDAINIRQGTLCANCGGPHATKTCEIPPNYDGNYHNDSKGTGPCNC